MPAGFIRYKNMDDRYKANIENNNLNKKSKKILWEWANERRANNFKDQNNIGLIQTIVTIIEQVGNDITKVSKQDLQKFFEKNNIKPSTELWYKKVLKRFYNWLSIHHDNVKYLLLINWINTKQLASKCSQSASKKREDNLLSPNDVRKMISGALLLRDKLAIALLSDCGVRAETIGAQYGKTKKSINCGQIEFHKGYAIIYDVCEKFDKKRNVIVTESLSYLIKYWNELPKEYRDNQKNPLFISYTNSCRGQRWGYSGLKDMLHEVSQRVLGRTINPHDFRHFKATRLSIDENLSDDSKCKLMGWSSRRMLDRYSHIKFDDAKAEYLEKKGIVKIGRDKKAVEIKILHPKQCYECDNICNITDDVCDKCGADFNKTEKRIKELERTVEVLSRFADKVMKNQNLRKSIEKEI